MNYRAGKHITSPLSHTTKLSEWNHNSKFKSKSQFVLQINIVTDIANRYCRKAVDLWVGRILWPHLGKPCTWSWLILDSFVDFHKFSVFFNWSVQLPPLSILLTFIAYLISILTICIGLDLNEILCDRTNWSNDSLAVSF